MNLKSIADELKKKLQQGVQTAGNAWNGYVQNIAKPMAIGTPQVRNLYTGIQRNITEPLARATNDYIQNTYVASARQLPQNYMQIAQPGIGNKIVGTAKFGFNLLGAIPDPTDAIVGGYNFLKGYRASGIRGGDLKQNLRSGIESTTYKNPIGLGSALTTNKTAENVGNLAELPLMLGITARVGKGTNIGYGKSIIDRFRNGVLADPVAKNAIQTFAAAVESGKDKRNLGNMGLTVQNIATDLFGDKARNLTNKQLKNLFDVLYRQAEDQRIFTIKKINPGFTTQNIREKLPTTKGVENMTPVKEVLNKRGKKIPTENLNNSEIKQQADIAQIQAEGGNFNDIFAKWIGKRDAAKTRATIQSSEFAKVPGNPEEIIRAIEDRKIKVTGEQKTYIDKIRSMYDSLFTDAKKSEIDMNYIQDYLTHIWQEPISQVRASYKSASQKFGFSKDRSLPTYEEGIQMGLTPKYNNPAQILNEYITKLEQTKANIELFNNLKDQGLIVHGSTVRGNPGFSPIDAPGFPASRVKINNDETYVGNWYAPTDIAQKINQVFTPQDYGNVGKAAGVLRNVSGTVQDVTMSGGIPGTPLNAWSFAQGTKEVLGGNPISPIAATFRTILGTDKKFFADNAGQIIKMQERNIPVNTSFKIENMIDQSTIKRTLGEKISNVWNKAVNDPTFQSFSPQLSISYFNKIEKAALKRGMSEAEAADVAAQAVKNFYGIKSSDKVALSNKLFEDLKGGIFFAPKYRETMWNFWAKNIKSLANPTALENRGNVIFMVGATATLIGMDAINKANTGHHMWENPSGKEDKMLIKTKDGYIGVPFLSSIATVPRTLFKMGKQTVKGDLKGAALTAKGFLSSAIRPPLDIISNENYYGGQITDPNNPSWTDRGLYLAGQYNHPYIQAGLNVAGQNLPKDVKAKLNITSQPEPLYQTASKALELPFRFYNNKTTGGVKQDAMQTAYYFDDRGQVEKSMDPQSLNLWNVLHPQKTNGREINNNVLSTPQKATILLNNPQVAAAEEALAFSQKQRGEQTDPIWDLTPEQRKLVWASQIQLPGQKNTYDTYLSGQEWYKPYLAARTEFYNSLPQTDKTTISSQLAYPEPSAEVQAQMDAKNWKDPGVQAWFKARDEYNNQQLLALGLPPIQSDSYTSKPKKVSLKVAKYTPAKITIKKRAKLKIPTIKVAKPKIKKTKIRRYSIK